MQRQSMSSMSPARPLLRSVSNPSVMFPAVLPVPPPIVVNGRLSVELLGDPPPIVVNVLPSVVSLGDPPVVAHGRSIVVLPYEPPPMSFSCVSFPVLLSSSCIRVRSGLAWWMCRNTHLAVLVSHCFAVVSVPLGAYVLAV